MNNYFATFISGFSEVIDEQIRSFDNNIEITKLLDGLVIFKTTKSIESVKNIQFFGNIFQLIDFKVDNKIDIHKYINDLAENSLISKDLAFIPKKNKFFRISVSNLGTLINIDKQIVSLLEKKISETFDLKVDRALPDSEFWIFGREDGIYLFGHRLTYHQDYKKVLQKGELRPDLCNLLCLLSEPNKEDVFIDPFSGSESIVKTRTKMMGYKKIISGDIKFDGDKKLDALNLKDIDASSVSKIVTDPPWGVTVGKNLDLEVFYKKMLSEFHRILVSGGILVILIGNKELFDAVLNNFKGKFSMHKFYDVLVNGKKARVYKLIKS